MKTTTTHAWAAALAIMSMQGPFAIAEAAPAQARQEPERPKYYFPRHVKRQFVNISTITLGPQNPPPDLFSPSPSSSSTTDTEAAVESLLSELGLTDTTPSTTPPNGTTTSTSTDASDPFASLLPPLTLPSVIVQPTPAPASSPDVNSPSDTTSTESTTAPILVGLSTFLLGTGSSEPSTTSTTPDPPLISIGITGPASGTAPTATGLLPGLLPTPTTSTSDFLPAASSTLPTPTSTADLVGIVSSALGQVTSILNSTLIPGLPIPTDASSALSEIVSSLSGDLSSILATPTPTPTDSSVLTGSGLPSGSFSLSTSGITVVPISIPTLGPVLSSILGGTTTATDNSTIPTGLPGSSSSVTASDSTLTASIPLSTDTQVTLSSTPGTVTSGIPTNGTVSTGVAATTTASSPSLEASTTSTGSGVATATLPANSSSTLPSTDISGQTTTTSSSQPQFSIEATGTDTATRMSIPTSLVFAPTATSAPLVIATGTGVPLGSSTTSGATSGLPTTLPRLVQPPGGMPPAPVNTTLIQVGFNYGLNYPFVVSTDNSASQIFAYLPDGIAYALSISTASVIMNALMPYDTTPTLRYVTTLAQAYVPSDLVNQLQMDLHTPLSRAYSNPDAAVHMLMSMINPTISILPGASMDDSGDGTSPNNPAATSGPGGSGAPIGGDSGSSQKVSSTSVGIGLGAVAGAAVYAAAMIYVARRYRKRKQSHQRSSSVPTAGEMSQRSPATLSGGMGGYFMSGGNGLRGSGTTQGSSSNRGSGRIGRGSRNSAGSSSNGRSVREAGISNPIMAENSLGWN